MAIKKDIESPDSQEMLEKNFHSSIEDLNKNISELNKTMILIREHEFVEFHKSTWRIFAHQILLGILFAIGTVMGLVLLSWMTYTFFKDSEILRGIVDNQLKMRQFDITQIKQRATSDANSKEQSGSTEKTDSGSLQK